MAKCIHITEVRAFFLFKSIFHSKQMQIELLMVNLKEEHCERTGVAGRGNRVDIVPTVIIFLSHLSESQIFPRVIYEMSVSQPPSQNNSKAKSTKGPCHVSLNSLATFQHFS